MVDVESCLPQILNGFYVLCFVDEERIGGVLCCGLELSLLGLRLSLA